VFRLSTVAIIICYSLNGLGSSSQQFKISKEGQSFARNRVMVDTSFLFLRGIGVAYERSVFSKMTFGGYAASAGTTTILPGDQSLDLPFYRSSATFLGIRSKYFFNSTKASGIYLSGGLVSVQAKTDAYFYDTTGETKSSSSIGLTGGAGYQFSLKNLGSVLNLGVMNGPGYRYNVSATKINTNQTRVDDVQVGYSLFFEASIGILF
jgi:hypothetical protein